MGGGRGRRDAVSDTRTRMSFVLCSVHTSRDLATHHRTVPPL